MKQERARNTKEVASWVDLLGAEVDNYEDFTIIISHINALNKYIGVNEKFKEIVIGSFELKDEIKVYKESVFEDKYPKKKASQINLFDDSKYKELESKIEKLMKELAEIKKDV